MTPDRFRTDPAWQPPDDRPNRSDLADEPPIGSHGPATRAELMAALTGAQSAAHEYTACPSCGTRCDICGERMCATYGPEPAATCPAHVECVDCNADNRCRECAAVRRAVA